MALFRKSKSSKDGDLKNENIDENILADTKYANLTIFGDVRFLNKSSKIENFPLSKTSFLKTDVREVMILCDIKKEEILSHKLLKLKENAEGTYKEAYEILKYRLNEISVIAEYRNIRLSIEDNITYEKASELYQMEMKVKEEYYKGIEKLAIKFYGAISDYGESIKKPIILCLD